VQRDEQGGGSPRTDPGTVAVMLPVKAFTDAKQRLSGMLGEADRVSLAKWCAERVVRAAGTLPVHVVCDDEAVADWANGLGVSVIRCSGPGLNLAIEQGLVALATAGFDYAIVAHGDLPLAMSFDGIALDGSITVVPDHRYDGTNALALPTALSGRFSFHYGRGSFRKHVIEAIAHSPIVRVLLVEELAHDLDTPDDLTDPRMEEVRQWLRTNPASPR